MRRRIVAVSPSEVFASDNAGDVIVIGNKRYCLIGRDPWYGYFVRYYWFDDWLDRLVSSIMKGEREDIYCSRRSNWD